MEENQAFDTTTASLAEKPASRFKVQNLVDIDPMREYLDAAEALRVGQCYDGLSDEDAAKMARAIVIRHGERTVSIETHDGRKRVIRVAQRELKPRKPKTPKSQAPAKKKAEKNV